MLYVDLSWISLSHTENLTVASPIPTVLIPNKVCLTVFNKWKWIFKTPSNPLLYRHLYFNGSSILPAIAWTEKPQCSHSSVPTSNPSVDMTPLFRTKILGIIADAPLSNSTSIPPGNPVAHLQINIKFNHFSHLPPSWSWPSSYLSEIITWPPNRSFCLLSRPPRTYFQNSFHSDPFKAWVRSCPTSKPINVFTFH